jgi:serine phosphatase RsbU (regulator of sigma subunit)
MPAALLAASICPEVRHLARSGIGPAEVLTRVNRHVCGTGVDGRFVTMALTIIDRRSHRMTVVNAGHWDPLVRRAGGAIVALGREAAGLPLGIDAHAVYRPVSVALEPEDLVLLYTDGVTEAMDPDGRAFGEQRLRQALAGAPRGADAVGESVLTALRDHSPGPTQHDDVTIVCLGRSRD